MTDGTNTSNYGANGLTATDVDGNSTLVNQTGLSFTNDLGATTGPSITAAGINAGNSTISNVADGVAANDVATFGQLSTTNAAVTDANNIASGNLAALGGGAAYDATNNIYTQPIYTLDDGSNTGTNVTANNVGDALNNLDGRTTTNTSNIANVQAQANQGFNISADNGTADNVQLGETVDFTNTDGNLVATVSDNGINYNLAENIDLGVNGSIRTGNTITNNAGVRIDDGNGNVSTLTATGTNVTDGTNTSNYDANGLRATNGFGSTGNYDAESMTLANAGSYNQSTAGSNVISNNTGNANINTATFSGILDYSAGNFNQSTAAGNTISNGTNTSNYSANGLRATDVNGNSTVVNQAGVSFTNNLGAATGPSITAAGINAGNSTISNVADGVVATDAATFGQLTDTDNIAKGNLAALGGGAAYDATNNIYTQPIYTLDDGSNTGTPTDYNDVGSALSNLNTRTTTNTSNIDDLTQGRIGLVRQDSGTGAISVGQNTNGTLVDFTGTEGTRTLTGLSNGSIAENSTDAVTGDQLNTTNNNVSSLQGKTFSLQANGDTATAVGQNDTVQFLDGDNINITRSGNNITVATARDVNFDSVSAGDNTLNTNGLSLKNINGKTEINGSTIYIEDDQNHTATYTAQQLELTDYDTGTGAQLTDTGLSFVDNFQFTGPSIGLSGIDAGDITIKNVAGGVNATDAVNKGQLDAFGNATAASLSPTASYNPVTGNIDNLVYTLDDGTNTGITANYGNVSGALGNLDARTTANTSNIDDLTQGRIGLVRQDRGTGAILLGQNTNGTLVDFTGTDGTRTLTGLSNGNIAENSTDAVTGDQLNTTNTNVTAAQNTGRCSPSDGRSWL